MASGLLHGVKSRRAPPRELTTQTPTPKPGHAPEALIERG